MKLYTVTYEHSLPRLALKGMPYGTLLYAELYEAVEEAFTMAEDDDSKPVILVMDGDAVEDITGVDGDWGEAMIEMAGSDVMYKAEEEGRLGNRRRDRGGTGCIQRAPRESSKPPRRHRYRRQRDEPRYHPGKTYLRPG